MGIVLKEEIMLLQLNMFMAELDIILNKRDIEGAKIFLQMYE